MKCECLLDSVIIQLGMFSFASVQFNNSAKVTQFWDKFISAVMRSTESNSVIIELLYEEQSGLFVISC